MFNKKEWDKEYSLRYRKEHPEWKRESNKKYNRKKYNRLGCYYNLEKRKEWQKRWQQKHLDQWHQILKNAYYRRKGAEGTHTIDEWRALKEKHNHSCVICHQSEPKIELTEDHIFPLSKGGTNWITNIQPLCRSCNSKKQDKLQEAITY